MTKDIPNFPGYAITDDGRVWSKQRKLPDGRTWAGRWLSPNKQHTGYLTVTLCRRGEHHQKLVHRLVLETFVGPCPDGMECCHEDGNRSNNKLTNLRWDTKSANTKDAVRHGTAACLRRKGLPGTRGEAHGMSKLTATQVRWIRLLRKGGLRQRELADIFGVKQPQISSICRNEAWVCE